LEHVADDHQHHDKANQEQDQHRSLRGDAPGNRIELLMILDDHSRWQPKTSCFSLRHNGDAPLQNPKTLALPVAIRYRPNVAAASRSFSRPHLSRHCKFIAHSRVPSFSVRETPFDYTARCAPSIYCSCLRSRLTVLASPGEGF
jgi:hypothetical protein